MYLSSGLRTDYKVMALSCSLPPWLQQTHHSSSSSTAAIGQHLAQRLHSALLS